MNRQNQHIARCRNTLRLGCVTIVVAPMVIMEVMVVVPAAQQPRAGDVDCKPDKGDRNDLIEAYWHRREKSGDRLIGDQHCDHRQNDGTGEPGEITELASAKVHRLSSACLRA